MQNNNPVHLYGIVGEVKNIINYNKAIVGFIKDNKEETAFLLGNNITQGHSLFMKICCMFGKQFHSNLRNFVIN